LPWSGFARTLKEIAAIAADTRKSSHQRYLAVYMVIDERDEQIATAFNDLRRSTAFMRLLSILSLNVLTEDELARFSPEKRASIEACRDM
jgi:hypothetical protein